jgi:tagatose 1,6-diphosphate aldolase
MSTSDPCSARIHGVAIDAGSGLATLLQQARGAEASSADLLIFKRSVLEVLGADASTVLVDAALGPQLMSHYPHGCERMMALEADVYNIDDEDRITVLPENLSAADYAAHGVRQLKFFMYYAPDDDDVLNARKQELVARVGQDCRAHNLVFLMEPLVYHPTLQPGTAEYAKLKPDLVRRATETFAHKRFHADVLKVEIPVDLDFVEGHGEPLFCRQAALQAFVQAAKPVTDQRLVYLSAGVSFERFAASLAMAVDAGVSFDGFMCGRALWSDAIAVYGQQGETGLRTWLQQVGRPRLRRLIDVVSPS